VTDSVIVAVSQTHCDSHTVSVSPVSLNLGG